MGTKLSVEQEAYLRKHGVRKAGEFPQLVDWEKGKELFGIGTLTAERIGRTLTEREILRQKELLEALWDWMFVEE